MKLMVPLTAFFAMATAPAVQDTIKTELSYWNDMIVVFLFAAYKNKDNAKVALASTNT